MSNEQTPRTEQATAAPQTELAELYDHYRARRIGERHRTLGVGVLTGAGLIAILVSSLGSLLSVFWVVVISVALLILSTILSGLLFIGPAQREAKRSLGQMSKKTGSTAKEMFSLALSIDRVAEDFGFLTFIDASEAARLAEERKARRARDLQRSSALQFLAAARDMTRTPNTPLDKITKHFAKAARAFASYEERNVIERGHMPGSPFSIGAYKPLPGNEDILCESYAWLATCYLTLADRGRLVISFKHPVNSSCSFGPDPSWQATAKKAVDLAKVARAYCEAHGASVPREYLDTIIGRATTAGSVPLEDGKADPNYRELKIAPTAVDVSQVFPPYVCPTPLDMAAGTTPLRARDLVQTLAGMPASEWTRKEG